MNSKRLSKSLVDEHGLPIDTSDSHSPTGSSPHLSISSSSQQQFKDYLNATDSDWNDDLDEFDPNDIEKLKRNTASSLSPLDVPFMSYGSSNSSISSPVEMPKKKTIDEKTASEIAKINNDIARIKKFESILREPDVDIVKLKKLSWSGIPEEYRPEAWQMLMGYLPCNSEEREAVLKSKRNEYIKIVTETFKNGTKGLDQSIYHQIHIDVPRTNPDISLYQNPIIQRSLEKILYCWAIRHTASGYVQGINDLITPFYHVFLSKYMPLKHINKYDFDSFPKEQLTNVEADSFWCLTILLDGIQDNYIHAQPGIVRQVEKMNELTNRIDEQLYNHLKEENVNFLQFAFRWMNCLLMREISLQNIIRMWDTYICEPNGFSEFHTYVCASLLVKWSKELKLKEFQDIVIFLQHIPTKDWTDQDIELLLSEAYMYKSLFHNSPNHLHHVAQSKI
ncbi:RabGAP/TBC, partial [Piromyces finnis]